MAHAREALVVMGVAIGLGAMAGAADAPASRDEVQRFVRAYIDATNGGDPSAVMDMVSRKPEASTVEMGAINRGIEAIRSEVEKLAATGGTHHISLGTMDVTFLGQGYALVVAPVTIDLSSDESQGEMRAAMTLVLEKSSGKWKVLHEHHSLQFPQEDAPGAAAD